MATYQERLDAARAWADAQVAGDQEHDTDLDRWTPGYGKRAGFLHCTCGRECKTANGLGIHIAAEDRKSRAKWVEASIQRFRELTEEVSA
jgi:hypothetical protein